ncbi:uncharacterized protein PFL1_01158 [Pseudozyma flocculosa PF-1]|uniref:Related to transaminase type I n=1 Tax=Pseudozyma flocculosa TaxID=84751 RepID=A0A5C3EWH7_9BASI|nr:uncharacterized protein PFL1_01158 [Pseudozyma flocculosa PF-1]EPQ30969.1 hypothetical protein PFL1_01158 [Pseudozyma flocculosa PF-1]SPO35807.1 related to transaminase type I [Pseudozyma flocculosa]
MASLPVFKVEQWMDRYETTCTHNLAETCCDSISLHDLDHLSRQAGIEEPTLAALSGKRLTYGHIRGSPELRQNIASLYPAAVADGSLGPDNVLVTQGAIGANFLVELSLVKRGDHVVCVHPTYQSLFEVPRSLGADVDLCRLDPADGWRFSVDRLASLLRPTTSLVILNNPNNPTGQALSRSTLDAIVEAVKARAAPGCIILSDEVYRPLFHSLPTSDDADGAPPCSILETGYAHAIATGSLSKAFSLAGIRVGWIATPRSDLIEAFAQRRDYNVISVSMVDDAIAARALHPRVAQRILERNTHLARTNRAILEAWIEKTPQVEWVPTQAGTTALLRLVRTAAAAARGGERTAATDEVDADDFCMRLHDRAGVLVAPGTCFDWQGWIRIGYVGNTQELQEGLDRITDFLRSESI